MTTEEGSAGPVANDEGSEKAKEVADQPAIEESIPSETPPTTAAAEADEGEDARLGSGEEEEFAVGASDAAPDGAIPTAPTGTAPTTPALGGSPSQEEDRRAAVEKQPYDYDKCTVQIAIQLLPGDQGSPSAPAAEQGSGDASGKGRRAIIGVRTHMDAPIVRMLRAEELGELPPVIMALLEQLKSELPAREQAAQERLEKDKEARARKHTKASPAKETKARKAAKPDKPKTVQGAAAPAPSVLTAEQRANAVNKANADDKQQLALF